MPCSVTRVRGRIDADSNSEAITKPPALEGRQAQCYPKVAKAAGNSEATFRFIPCFETTPTGDMHDADGKSEESFNRPSPTAVPDIDGPSGKVFNSPCPKKQTAPVDIFTPRELLNKTPVSFKGPSPTTVGISETETEYEPEGISETENELEEISETAGSNSSWASETLLTLFQKTESGTYIQRCHGSGFVLCKSKDECTESGVLQLTRATSDDVKRARSAPQEEAPPKELSLVRFESSASGPEPHVAVYGCDLSHPLPGKLRHLQTSQGNSNEVPPLEMGRLIYSISSEHPKEIKQLQPMYNALIRKGEKGSYSSNVSVVDFLDNTLWVLKVPKLPKDGERPKDLEESEDINYNNYLKAAGEFLAYKVSEHLELKLVPTTKLVIDDSHELEPKLGSLQRYVENTKSTKECITYLNQNDLEAIQRLKLFWFILGQWDVRPENVLVQNDGTPVAIDNGGIFDPEGLPAALLNQEGSYYIYDLTQKISDQGSRDHPKVVEGTRAEVSNKIEKMLGVDTPREFKKKQEGSFSNGNAMLDPELFKRAAQEYNAGTIKVSYFIKECKFYRYYATGGITSLKEGDRIQETVLKQFDGLNKPLLNGLFEQVYQEIQLLFEKHERQVPPEKVRSIINHLKSQKESFIKAVMRRKEYVLSTFRQEGTHR